MATALAVPAPRVRRLLLVAMMTVMVVEIAGVTISSPRVGHGRALGMALAADMVLFLCAALVIHGGPRTAGLSPRKAASAALLGVVLFSLLARLAGMQLGSVLLPLAALGEAVLIGFLIRALLRARREPGVLLDRLHDELSVVLPEPVVRVLLLELRMLSVAFLRPRRPTPAKDLFPPMAVSASGWVIPFITIVSVVELGAIHGLLAAYGPKLLWPHVLVFGLHAYGLLWLIGDRRLMEESAHRLEDDALVLSLGARFSARIPYGQISRALPLRNEAERRSVQPRAGRKNPCVSPLDPPNVHLCLERPVTYTTFFGLQRQTQHLDLFVDRPEAFLAGLDARLRPLTPRS